MAENPNPTPADDADPRATRLRRLRFRAWRRGFKEADLVLGGFADAHLDKLDDAGLDAFEALLALDDHQVYAWVVGREAAPAEHDTKVLELLKSFGYFTRSLWAGRPDGGA